MNVTPHTKIRLGLVASLLALASFAVPSARAQDERMPKPEAPSQQSVRERWNALTPDEQRRLMDNYDHWKKLSQDDRSLMQRRFERLEAERGRVRDSLDEKDRRALETLRDPERRSELTRRAKAALHDRFEQLPPDLRRRIHDELRSLPRAERERRVKQAVKQHVEGEIGNRLRKRVENGELSPQSVEELRTRLQQLEGDPRARLELLRRFRRDHPDALRGDAKPDDRDDRSRPPRPRPQGREGQQPRRGI
jgi:hypothetical protein